MAIKSKNEAQTIDIPFNYDPRGYQLPSLRALDNGIKRAVVVWPRRSGKEKTFLNYTAKKMLDRVGSYYYFFPTYKQGRKILWEGMDYTGFKFLSHFPKPILAGKPKDDEMKLEYRNGSIFRVIGTDDIDSIVGTNPVGCVFSEYALQDPAAWDYIRPILAENGGWAIFDFTPRGENYGWDIYQLALNDPDNWFCELLTVDDTKHIDKDVLDRERKEIMLKYGNDSLFQQEYYCSFKAANPGAYYAAQINRAEKEKRITGVPYDSTVPVDTWWDLGIDDSMTIWFSQSCGREIHFIDYYEASGEGLVHCAGVLKDKAREGAWVFGTHTAPHDIEVRELSTGVSRKETAKKYGINFNVAQRLSVEDGIDAARNIFSRCWFDSKKCHKGINALKSYHKEYDEKNKVFLNKAKHDWSSHGADSFRTFAVSFRDIKYHSEEEMQFQFKSRKY